MKSIKQILIKFVRYVEEYNTARAEAYIRTNQYIKTNQWY